ncbi:NAD(P)H-binding protein [Pediococcus pentosaceus]|uniref:NAD(P)H-binding protein n=1 Tax=Pediococcus pentosaceus TaxID=1255 RepID=A0AB73HFQ5_PEDPE|nr:NAD(P)H-binding protein [Pediococcus pentosaceus]MBF7114171.1 NAD(P)H-binding protein [Pediococcus pentosaceus]MCM6792160.1 NAD(P)H-binding protein [Pediococcus pentosaceus]MCM6809456.1 NAD(P)H-binding protein [Pediococcus pentosaceus]MDN3206130.1 NAD(P)H-binding protein [Pediococcus pentosaceus]
MMNVLIIGATGTIGNAVRQTLLSETDANLTLFARSANRLKPGSREKVVAGDVNQVHDLDQAMKKQDVVFVALSGNLGTYAENIVSAMKRNQIDRLLFVTSMGIYNEIPATIGSNGNLEYNSVLSSYRQAADVVEASDLNYTVIRPGWFTSGPVDYEVTLKGEPFGGNDVSVSSIADLVKRLTLNATLYSRDSVGINTPQ